MTLTKAELLVKLRDANIGRVSLVYSGYGDEGHVDDTDLYDMRSELASTTRAERKLNSSYEPLLEDLYEFVHAQLNEHSPGWELDAGSDGEVTIEVTATNHSRSE